MNVVGGFTATDQLALVFQYQLHFATPLPTSVMRIPLFHLAKTNTHPRRMSGSIIAAGFRV